MRTKAIKTGCEDRVYYNSMMHTDLTYDNNKTGPLHKMVYELYTSVWGG